jgi:hypothetical protein
MSAVGRSFSGTASCGIEKQKSTGKLVDFFPSPVASRRYPCDSLKTLPQSALDFKPILSSLEIARVTLVVFERWFNLGFIKSEYEAISEFMAKL